MRIKIIIPKFHFFVFRFPVEDHAFQNAKRNGEIHVFVFGEERTPEGNVIFRQNGGEKRKRKIVSSLYFIMIFTRRRCWRKNGGPQRFFGRTLRATIVPGPIFRPVVVTAVRRFAVRRRTRHVHEVGPRGFRSGRGRQRHHLVGRTVGRVARMSPRHVAQVQVPRVHVLTVLETHNTARESLE